MEGLHYEEFPVPHDLKDAVRCIWSLEGAGGGEDMEPVLPDGCMELILHHAVPFEELEGGVARLQPQAFLYGQITRTIQLRPSSTCGIIGVRFQPHGAHAFFRTDMSAFTDRKALLTELMEAPERFAPVMAAAVPTDERVRRTIVALRSLRSEGSGMEKAVSDLVQGILTEEDVPLGPLKSVAPLSTRQVERRFLAVVGLRPKVFARIVRLRRLIDRARGSPQGSLAAWAHAAGYYDQAHFNRDFKAFTGRTPKEYFGQELSLPDAFSGLP